MILRANALLESMVGENPDETAASVQDMPVAAFSLLAAIPTYILASIAAHTKPGNDYFSTTLFKAAARRTKRQRGYSSGSDPVSDGESVETDG